MSKKVNRTRNKNSITTPCNTIILFAVIYSLLFVISVIERVSILKNLSTTNITFMTVFKEFWFSIVVIVLLVATAIIYRKREFYGATLECAIGFSMLVNVLISVIVVGFDVVALLVTLILPAILIIHSVIILVKIRKQKSG